MLGVIIYSIFYWSSGRDRLISILMSILEHNHIKLLGPKVMGNDI